MNPKFLHILAEFVQLGGTLGTVSGIAGSINPIAGTACAILAGIATVLKPYIIPAVVAPTPGVTVQTSTAGH